MRADGLPIAIETFADYYRRLAEGEQGVLPEDGSEPVDDLPDAAAARGGFPNYSTAPWCSSSTAASARAWG